MYTKSIAAVAALASIASAAPSIPTMDEMRKGFSVTQVPSGKKGNKSGAIALQRAYNKYNAEVPSAVVNAAAAQSGSVTANPEEGGSEYVAAVQIEGQTINLDFDTGSSDLWVFGNQIPQNEQSGHTIYSPSGSPMDGYSWSISYGDGSGASGNVYKQQVVVGGVTAPSQAVEVATAVTASQQEPTPFAGSSGLLGLAFSSINTVKPQSQLTFFDSVKSSLPSQLFTATLKNNAPGSYDFGYIDDSKYSGSITYTSVDNSQGFWSFTADGASANGQQLAGSFSAIADTGTTLALLDDDLISNYYGMIDGAQNDSNQGGWIFPCDASIPDFVVTIAGYDATIPGSFVNFQEIGDGTCFGGIQSDSGIGFSILGDVFLKSQYVVFDASGPQLGFAPQA